MNQTNLDQTNQKTIDIWLDCDPGVDDCFALILAAGHPKFNLIGVSTSSGNVTVEHTTKNALDFLSHINRSDVPVYMGARCPVAKGSIGGESTHGEKGLVGIQLIASKIAAIVDNTFEEILKKIMGNPRKVTFICTGALTNLSLLLRLSPNFKQKIQKVSLMGGAIGKGNVSSSAEFNIYFDPLAAQHVFSSNLDISIVPLQVTHTALCTSDILQKMRERKSQISNTLVSLLTNFQKVYFQEQGFEYPPLHDPCAVYYILQPHQFQTKKALIEIDCYPVSYGRTNFDFRSKTPNVTVCTKMNVKRFWDVMLSNYKIMVPSSQ